MNCAYPMPHFGLHWRERLRVPPVVELSEEQEAELSTLARSTRTGVLLSATNYATHKHPAVQQWLAKHPRFNMHFTPTSASWLNMVERFFRDISENRLRRGVFTSVPELVTAIDEYVAHHNIDPKPFI